MASPAVSTAEAPLVLIIDDTEDNRRIYGDYLQASGYRVAEAGDGREGLRLARELRPAVVVMDLAMPDLDGWEATRLLKEDAETCTIGIVALSAFREASSRRRAKECGADFFVSKPCVPSELLLHVAECLRRRRA